MYIEVKLDLNAYDLILLEALTAQKIKDLQSTKRKLAKSAPHGIELEILNDRIYNYKVTLKKIRNARAEVAEIKAAR